MTESRQSVCEWCELPIEDRDRPVRLSTSQPPWTFQRARGAAAAAAYSFSATLRALIAEDPEVTLWFHRSCWDKFHRLLQGRAGE